VLSGKGLSDGLITRPDESYRLWCVLVCDLGTSRRRRLKLVKGCKCQEEEEEYEEEEEQQQQQKEEQEQLRHSGANGFSTKSLVFKGQKQPLYKRQFAKTKKEIKTTCRFELDIGRDSA
jgi:hypothetical protein